MIATALGLLVLLVIAFAPTRVTIFAPTPLIAPSVRSVDAAWFTPDATSASTPIDLLILDDGQFSSELLMQVVSELRIARLRDQQQQLHHRYQIRIHSLDSLLTDPVPLLQEQHFDFLLLSSTALLRSLQPVLSAKDLTGRVVLFDNTTESAAAALIDERQVVKAPPQIARTIELALQTFPERKRLLLIGDTRAAPEITASALRQAQEIASARQLRFVSLLDQSADDITTGMTEGELTNTLIFAASLPPGDSPEAQLSSLCSRPPVMPVVCCNEQLLRHGAVAAWSVDAKHLAQRLDQYLTGRASSVVDESAPHSFFLHGQQLTQLLGALDQQLPRESVLQGFIPLINDQSNSLTVYDYSGRVAAVLLITCTILFLLQHLFLARQRLQLLNKSLQFARLTTLGYYSAALGHQLSQPLGAMLNNLEAIRALVRNGGTLSTEDTTDILKDIQSDHARIFQVVESIRSLARKSPQVDVAPVSAVDLCQRTIAGLRQQHSFERVHWELQAATDLPLVLASESLLEQALINVLTNSGEAISARSSGTWSGQTQIPFAKGTVTVSLSAFCNPSNGNRNGVLIQCTDDGVPFPEEYLSAEPGDSVTSKPDGLGMGLQIARMILEEQNGWLRIKQNTADKQVMIWLPMASESEKAPPSDG